MDQANDSQLTRLHHHQDLAQIAVETIGVEIARRKEDSLKEDPDVSDAASLDIESQNAPNQTQEDV